MAEYTIKRLDCPEDLGSLLNGDVVLVDDIPAEYQGRKDLVRIFKPLSGEHEGEVLNMGIYATGLENGGLRSINFFE